MHDASFCSHLLLPQWLHTVSLGLILNIRSDFSCGWREMLHYIMHSPFFFGGGGGFKRDTRWQPRWGGETVSVCERERGSGGGGGELRRRGTVRGRTAHDSQLAAGGELQRRGRDGDEINDAQVKGIGGAQLDARVTDHPERTCRLDSRRPGEDTSAVGGTPEKMRCVHGATGAQSGDRQSHRRALTPRF